MTWRAVCGCPSLEEECRNIAEYMMREKGYYLGRVVQVHSIKTRVESANGFSPCN
jgi:hypothetical protein